MSYYYADPNCERGTALPNIETWSDTVAELECSCGAYDVPLEHTAPEAICPSCGADALEVSQTERTAWFGWFCFPGCLPDSGLFGPYDTEAELVAAMREGFDE